MPLYDDVNPGDVVATLERDDCFLNQNHGHWFAQAPDKVKGIIEVYWVVTAVERRPACDGPVLSLRVPMNTVHIATRAWEGHLGANFKYVSDEICTSGVGYRGLRTSPKGLTDEMKARLQEEGRGNIGKKSCVAYLARAG